MTDGGLRYPAEAGCSRSAGLERPAFRSEGHGDAYLALDDINLRKGAGACLSRHRINERGQVFHLFIPGLGCPAWAEGEWEGEGTDSFASLCSIERTFIW